MNFSCKHSFDRTCSCKQCIGWHVCDQTPVQLICMQHWPELQLDFAQHMNQTTLSVLPAIEIISYIWMQKSKYKVFTMCKNRSPIWVFRLSQASILDTRWVTIVSLSVTNGYKLKSTLVACMHPGKLTAYLDRREQDTVILRRYYWF